MSTEEDKFHHSRRLQKDQNAIAKQKKIAKAYGVPVQEPHKFAKHHAMNCGNPDCVMCGNPRKMFDEKTIQEKRMYQDADTPNDKHSNGLTTEDD